MGCWNCLSHRILPPVALHLSVGDKKTQPIPQENSAATITLRSEQNKPLLSIIDLWLFYQISLYHTAFVDICDIFKIITILKTIMFVSTSSAIYFFHKLSHHSIPFLIFWELCLRILILCCNYLYFYLFCKGKIWTCIHRFSIF